MTEFKNIPFTAKRFALPVLPLVFVLCMIIFNTSVGFARERVERQVSATDLDYALRDALNSRDLAQFRHHLLQGGDPTVWFENSQFGWVYCAATEQGLEAYLQLIIDKGFDVNFRQTDINSAVSLPLTCAVRFGNLRALDMLISVGADPAVRICLTCDDRAPRSVMAEAAMVRKYHLAAWLVDKGNYSDAQMKTVIYGIENFPVDESSPGNVHRLKLADLIRERGFEVNSWTREKSKDR